MKHNPIEVLISIFDVFIFNNPVGITSLIMALLVGTLMCIYGNIKSRIICLSSLLVLSICSVVICVAENSPDYLILPIFMLPFFVVILIMFLIYDFIKFLIK